MRKNIRILAGAFCLIFINNAFAAPASVKAAKERAENAGKSGETLLLPYLFSTDDMGFNIGVGAMRAGFLQEQFTAGVTYFDGDSRAFAVGLWDFRLPGSDRIYLSGMSMQADYPRLKAYTTPQAVFLPADEARGGAHNSSPENYIAAQGSSDWSEVKLEYVLPFGASRESGWIEYKLRGGLLVSHASGGNQWNPIESGVSVLLLRQFNKFQRYEMPDGDPIDGTSHAIELGLLYDNTDFPINPSFGSSQYFSYSHEPGLASDFEWNAWQFEASKYISLGATAWARQRVLAFNSWLAYSPSWEYFENETGEIAVRNAPPFMDGASLGGLYRMRGFDQHRFHDKAAVYATAEYRYTLNWNPFNEDSWLRFLKIDWLQAVAFVEGGRVAPEFTNTLLKDWKSDIGLGVRTMATGIVIRFDAAHSAEGNSYWVMVGHPF